MLCTSIVVAASPVHCKTARISQEASINTAVLSHGTNLDSCCLYLHQTTLLLFSPAHWGVSSRNIALTLQDNHRRSLLVMAGQPVMINSTDSIAGLALGSITERGRGTILHFDVETLYINVALGLLSTVSALRTFGVHRTVFYREASSGLNK